MSCVIACGRRDYPDCGRKHGGGHDNDGNQPGVEYTITRNGKVKEVRFLNDDAEGALAKVALKGQSLDTAVALTVAAYKAAGFMESNDTVLISFDKKLSETPD